MAVDLKPLTPSQVQVFMQIEYPEFPPVALEAGPATIGAFYDTVANGFKTVNPTIIPNAFAVNLDEATPIKSVADALAAIKLTQGSPDQPPQGNTTLAHYYVFKEIFSQKTLVQDAAGNWSFTGAAIPFPTSFDFQQSTVTPSPPLAFNQSVSQLLIGLQTCWTSGAQPNIGAIGALERAGIKLIKQGIRPEFLWAPPA